MENRSKVEAAKSERPLERYLRMMEVISTFSKGITFPELLDVLDLPKTTVHRLLNSLVESGAVELSQMRRDAYVIGKRMLQMAYVGSPDNWIELLTRPALSDLAEASSFTAFVTRLSDDAVRSVASVTHGSPGVHAYVVPGSTLWAHAGATAKAIASFQSRAVKDRLLPDPLPKLTSYTITDRKALEAQFDEIREKGYAFCKQEDILGFGGIGAPVTFDGSSVSYAVGITGPSELLFAGKEVELAHLVIHAAERVASALRARAGQDAAGKVEGAIGAM
jgi:DNA-binding IclR family transcriptional regulator